MWSGLAWRTALHQGPGKKPPWAPGPALSLSCSEAPTSSPHGPEPLKAPCGHLAALLGCTQPFLLAHVCPLSAVGLPQPPAPHLSSTATDGSTLHTDLSAASLPASPMRKCKLLCGITSPWWSADHSCPATQVCSPSHPRPKPGVGPSLSCSWVHRALPLFLMTAQFSLLERSGTQACYRHGPRTLATPCHPYVQPRAQGHTHRLMNEPASDLIFSPPLLN